MITDKTIAMMDVISSLQPYLLKKKDYLTVRSGHATYLFLSETLQYFKVTNPSVDEYLRLCQTGKTDCTFLTEAEIVSIGNYLIKKGDVTTASLPDEGHNFLILNLTGGCNLACKYCFAEITTNHQTMTFEVAKKAIDNMKKQGLLMDEYSIYFFGGEPLLKTSLLKQITTYAYEAIVEKGKKKLQFLINTNATLVNDEAIRLLKTYDFKVTVSLDGPMAYHDRNRVYNSGKGSFGRVMAGIDLLKANGICTNLRATFSPDTEELVPVFEFFESLQLPYTYSFTINSEYKMNLKDTLFEDRQFETVERELRKVMDFFHTKISHSESVYYTGLHQKLAILKYKKKRIYACEAGRRSMTVDEQGNYYACQNMIPYKQTVMGHVNTGIFADKKLQYRSKKLHTLTGCHACVIRNLCAGGCEVERNSPNQKTQLQMCRLFQIEWKNHLYLYALLMESKKN